MRAERLQDRIWWGMNVAARNVGMPTDAYRPRGASNPLAPENRFLRLHTVFANVSARDIRPVSYGTLVWRGTFDAAYTRPGDYLVREDGTWFIAAQQALLPVLCVRADRTVSFSRPAAQGSAGINGYGGVTAATLVPVLTNWRAGVSTASGGGKPEAALPGDATVPYWTVLLPAYPGTVLRVADLMEDDLGRNAVVAAAELGELGWRLTVKQATT